MTEKIDMRGKRPVIKKLKIEDKKFIKRYEEWCESQGWQRGTGVNSCKGCYHHTSDGCDYYLDTKRRRPCPPWDCTEYVKGRRITTSDRQQTEGELF